MNLGKFSMPAFSSATAILVGCLVLVGWMFDSTTLKSVFPGLVTMKANTALAFILAGASLWFLRAERISRPARRIAQVCAAAAALIGLFTLVEYLFGLDLGMDQLLFEDTPDSVGTSAPGRMGFNTAFSFLALGVALLLLAVEVPWRHWLAQVLAGTVALFSLLAALGYVFGLEFLYVISASTSMALHTAITFTLFSLGVLLARSGQGFMRIFTPGGTEAVRSPYAWLPYLMIVMVLAVLVSMAVTLRYVQNLLIASTGESLALVAADIADKLDRTLFYRYSDIQAFAKAAVFQRHDPKAQFEYVSSLRQLYPIYLWIGVADARGTIVASTDPARMGQDWGGSVWFKAVRSGNGVFVEDAHVLEDSGGVMAVTFTAPIRSPRGAFLGAVTTGVELSVLEEVFASTTRALQIQRGTGVGKLEWQFLTRDGEVIVDSLLRQEGTVNLKTLGLPSALLTGSARPGYIEEMHRRRHVPVVTGYAQTEQRGDYLGLHWGVLVRMDRKDVVAPIHEVLWKLGVASVVVFVPTIGLLLWATGKLRQEWAFAQEKTVRATAAEAEASESADRTRLIINTALDAVIVMDADGQIIEWNPQAESVFGWTRMEAVERSLAETIIPPQYREAHTRGLKHFMVTGEGPVLNKRIEITACRRDGQEFPVELAISPVRSVGTITFSAFVRDVTERKRAENELRQAKEAAEAASRAKSEFLASMSHEIRTPMNAIIGMADLLQETPLSQEQKGYVRVFRRAGGTLLALVNDILDLSKVEAGHMELEEVDFDLRDVVEKAVEVVAFRAHEKGLEVTNYIMSDVPTDLVGDPTRLRQVLLNLLGNAVKFAERGEVVLRVAVEPSLLPVGAHGRAPSSPAREGAPVQEGVMNHAPTIALRFSVSDTGIGIPPDKLETIFERFTQVDSSTTRRYGGTGLGLTIAKSLIELMGGRIWVESRVGHSTTFSFTLRARVWRGPKRRVERHPVDMSNLHTLVVDDNATNRLILHEMLTGWKARVVEAAGGEEALARLRCAQEAGDPYRLVLLDCRMPDMDGFQVVDVMKRQRDLTNVTIMMLTSDGRGGDLARARELGLAGYMVKPVKRVELLAAISAALGTPLPSRQALPSATVPAPADMPPPLSILLAEDAADNRLLIQAYLKQTPYRLDVAENGEVACGKFKSGRYDLVLMDVQMPVMDGYDATRAIREWERVNHRPPVPILALTAHALQGDAEKSLEAGCTAHLTKPIKKATLLEAITAYSPVANAAGTRSGGR